MVFLFLLLVLVPHDKNNYLMAYNKKCCLLDSVPSPRIIFVGGSNLCFGLDSKRIEDSLRVRVINYGLHAGIGLKFMVDDVAEYVTEGDRVVFAPEYDHFYQIMYGEAETLAPLMAYSGWKKCRLLNTSQMLQVMKGLPYVIRMDIHGLLPEKDTTVYSLEGINDYGDESRHWTLPDKPVPPDKPAKGNNLDKEFGYYFIGKVEEMERRGVRVVIIPPVIRTSSYEAMKPQILALCDFLAEEEHPFLVPPEHHVLPDSCAYDTPYHMNKSGVDRFTSLVISELGRLVR